MSDTKDRILQKAIDLFNERGVNNVSLRDLASAVGISPGNLAYHFKNQDFIIQEAFRQMEAERETILAGVQQIPSFTNIRNQIGPLLKLAQRYRFFHLDTVHLFRSYPTIAKLQQAYFEASIAYVRAVIDHSVGAGTLQPERMPGQYDRLAHLTWMLMTFWLEQATIRGKKQIEVEVVQDMIWDLVRPHLTPKGADQLQSIMSSKGQPRQTQSRSQKTA